jgi:hypothetical protein
MQHGSACALSGRTDFHERASETCCCVPDQAKALAVDSAAAQARAAGASLRAVEEGIATHAAARDYGKLKEIAEASGLAAKVRW